MNFAARGANGALLLVLCLRLDVVVSSEATCTADDQTSIFVGSPPRCLSLPSGCKFSGIDLGQAELAHNNIGGQSCGFSAHEPTYSKCRTTPSLVCGEGVSYMTGDPFVDFGTSPKYHQQTTGSSMPGMQAVGRQNMALDLTNAKAEYKNCNDHGAEDHKCDAEGYVDDQCWKGVRMNNIFDACLLYTSDAADE